MHYQGQGQMFWSKDAGRPLWSKVVDPLVFPLLASFRLIDFFNFVCSFSMTSLR